MDNSQKNEQDIISKCMRIILEDDSIDDNEFQTRLGFDRHDLRNLITVWPQTNSFDNMLPLNLVINNCLNEICYGISTSDSVLEKKYSISRQIVKQVYTKWQSKQ